MFTQRDRRRASAVAVLALITGLGACAGAEADPNQSTTDSDGSEGYRISVIFWDINDVYTRGLNDAGIDVERDRLEEELGVDIELVKFGSSDPGEQTDAIRAQMQRGVDGVLLMPWRGEAMPGIIRELHAEDIPVVVHNAFVPDVDVPFVSIDNVLAGRLAGEALVANLESNRGPDWADEGGVIVEVRCNITASFDIQRTEGYRSVLDPIVDAHDDLTIVSHEANCNGADARSVIDDAIARHGADRIVAVTSVDGTSGVGGVLPALRAQGLMKPRDHMEHIPVTTIDCSKGELGAVLADELTHCTEQSAIAEGTIALRLLMDMVVNDSLQPSDGAESIDGDEEMPWAPIVITPGDEFDGMWYQTQGVSVPSDVPADSELLWANTID